MDAATTKPRLVPSTRFALSLAMFFGCLVTYMMRTNMSFAVVCMVSENKTDTGVEKVSRCGKEMTPVDSNSSVIGEFDWDKKTTGMVLSSFFYGYIGSQIIGGHLASRYGGKRVVFITILGSSLLTLANPVAARTSEYALAILRAAIGFLQGATFPAMHTMWSVWGPPLELSVLTGVTYAGAQIGNVIVLPLSGFLCQYGFDGGWPSIFYILGVFGVIWCAVWWYISSDKPATHPRISKEEKQYIITSVEASMGKDTGKVPSTPWIKILTSPAVWACWAGHFAGDWGAYTMLVSLPSFLKDVLGLNLSSVSLFIILLSCYVFFQLGAVASIPYMAYFCAINAGGILADTIRSKGILSTLNTRRAAMLVALVGQGLFLVLSGYCGCGQDVSAVSFQSNSKILFQILVIIFITCGMAVSGFQYAGFVVNYLEIAPPFSGTVMGTGNTISALAGIISPAVTSYLTPNGTQEEWQVVMWLTAGILTAGALIFSIFASGEVQPWAKLSPEEGHEMAPLREGEKIELATA
ncbi:hypothetical protein CRE_25315 [Caenorhabditis remanei]|uniref:Major facilitator superfamily (MFS) profile domain-containing protein n=1 Tax=Caenorhabditis remanei TaxID=31234 RepID=E3LSH2_CAERE|nr:hypothetical protein CRE_25315 [Caenorhabditis remanei]